MACTVNPLKSALLPRSTRDAEVNTDTLKKPLIVALPFAPVTLSRSGSMIVWNLASITNQSCTSRVFKVWVPVEVRLAAG